MLTVIFGLSGALIFGAADFLGGLAAKRISPVLATAVAAATGLVALLAVLPLAGGTWSAPAVLWGALSGVSGTIAIALLYACLAVGPMSILSPLTAVVSAVVPMAVGLLAGEEFGAVGVWAFGLALVAVVLVGFVPEKGAVRPSPRPILMAVGSGVMIGAFLVLIDMTPADSGLVPMVMNRAASATIMFSVVGVLALSSLRKPGHVTGAGLTGRPGGAGGAGGKRWVGSRERGARAAGIRLAVVCGVVDVVANGLLLVGVRVGELSVMSVLTAMYPAGTILLAAVVLKERIAPVQWAGLILALVAAALFAIA